MKKIASFFKSLRAKIFFLAFSLGIVFTILLSLFVGFSYRSEEVNSEILSVSSQARIINSAIVSTGYISGTDNESVRQAIEFSAQALSGRILVLDGSLKVIKDSYSLYEGKTVVWDIVLRAAGGENASSNDEKSGLLAVAVPIIDDTNATSIDDETTVLGVLLFVKQIKKDSENTGSFRQLLVLFLFFNAIFSFILSWFLSKAIMKPVNNVASRIDSVTKGLVENELAPDKYTETARIYDSFNAYANRMKTLDESRQEFVSNVSHELKTPLASMKVLADSINSMPDAPVDMYREFMGDITGEIDRENNIISDLLTLVKFDKTKAEINISQVRLNTLLEEIMKRLRPLADKASVELVLESFRPVTAEVDETKFSLAVSNLIENAIKYNNQDGGFVHVSLNADHQYFYIHVEDNGIGIPEESVDHIFERFYRADKSHSREIGGTGLGLSITESIIQMHKGEIKVHSVLGEGTEFVVRVPLHYISDDSEEKKKDFKI